MLPRGPAGEVAPDAGEVLVCGVALHEHPAAARRHLGYCPQARWVEWVEGLVDRLYANRLAESCAAGAASACPAAAPACPRAATALPCVPPACSALPAQMTGREVLWMYARLRWVGGAAGGVQDERRGGRLGYTQRAARSPAPAHPSLPRPPAPPATTLQLVRLCCVRS